MKDELLMKEENRKKRQESLSIIERIQGYIDGNLQNQQLLVDTDLTVEAIVKEIGFDNASSFIRKFSSVVGMTPGKYRETRLRS